MGIVSAEDPGKFIQSGLALLFASGDEFIIADTMCREGGPVTFSIKVLSF